MSILEELRSTLDGDPGGVRADQLVDDLLGNTLNLLTRSDAEGLDRWAAETAELAKELLSRSEPGPATWRLWYAGHLQAVAGLARALLGQRLALSTTAMLRQRNKVPLLSALSAADSNVSELAAKLDLDRSQLIRELEDLVRHQLVETAKEGRERWVRITHLGRRALDEARSDAAPSPQEENSAQPVSLKDLYIGQLRDLYGAEIRVLDALPKMVEAAGALDPRRGLDPDLQQTREHVNRLELISQKLNEKPTSFVVPIDDEEAVERLKKILQEATKTTESVESFVYAQYAQVGAVLG